MIPIKLHLGCGRRYLPGFRHVDLDDFPHIDHRHGIDRLPEYADDSVALIYCCHAFEYFDRLEARAVLAEWRRVLAPNGTLRLAVPDFAALAALYLQDRDLDRLLGPLFGRMPISAPLAARTIYHRTAYDFESLETLLVAAGFHQVRRYDWRQTEHRDIDDFSQAYLPHLDKERGVLVSLNVEADKTPRRSNG
jgi:predicted SAM-dependent methyltransferase